MPVAIKETCNKELARKIKENIFAATILQRQLLSLKEYGQNKQLKKQCNSERHESSHNLQSS